MWLKKITVSALLVLGILSVSPFQASAHATPVSYVPVAGSTELKTPTSVSVRFTERIEAGASSLTVFDKDGKEVQEGKGSLDQSDGRELTVPITDHGEGVYTVSWQVVSVDDGHFTKGAFSFLVDATGKQFVGNAEGTQVAYSTNFNEAVISFVALVGESLFFVVVALLYLGLYQRRKGFDSLLDLEFVSPILKHTVTLAGILFIGATALEFVSKTLELSGLQHSTFIATVPVYLFSTVGKALLSKVIAGVLFLVLFVLVVLPRLASKRSYSIALATLGVLLAAIIYIQSQLSHAAASLFYPKLSIFITFVHLSGKEFIIGGLIVLLAVWITGLAKGQAHKLIIEVAYFNVLAAGALFFATVSGAYISWLHLKHFSNLTTTEWGVRFIILLSATMVLGAFRLWHQFIVTDRLSTSRLLRKIFVITLPVEVALGLLVLFYSGYISITTPPFLVEQYTFSESAVSQGVNITLDTHPYEKDSFRVTFTDAATHAAIDPVHVYVSAKNTDKGIGPNVLSVAPRFVGGYVFAKQLLSPAGNWVVHVVAQQSQGYDATADFKLSYPSDVDATKLSDTTRSFDSFTRLMIIIGVLATLMSLLICAHAFWQVAQIKKQRIEKLPSEKVSYVLSAIISLLLIIAMFGSVYVSYLIFVGNAFETECVRDGAKWQQAYPTRYFSATSPNAFNGCFVHGGHFHFVDPREYEYFKAHEQEIMTSHPQ